MDSVISRPGYKWTILQKNDRKMTIKWSFSYNSFVKFRGKKIGSNSMTKLYPKVCYNIKRLHCIMNKLTSITPGALWKYSEGL